MRLHSLLTEANKGLYRVLLKFLSILHVAISLYLGIYVFQNCLNYQQLFSSFCHTILRTICIRTVHTTTYYGFYR